MYAIEKYCCQLNDPRHILMFPLNFNAKLTKSNIISHNAKKEQEEKTHFISFKIAFLIILTNSN